MADFFRILLKVHFPYRLTVSQKPLDGLLQPVAQVMAGLKPEELFGATDVQTAPRLTVWF
jgi:hypothetical protein